jgi:hypothetical protein
VSARHRLIRTVATVCCRTGEVEGASLLLLGRATPPAAAELRPHPPNQSRFADKYSKAQSLITNQ